MSFYFKCNTCGDSTGDTKIDYTHYDEKELFEIWRVRKAFVEIYKAGLPIRIADGHGTGLLSFINAHHEHDVVLHSTNSCRFYCEIPKGKEDLKAMKQIRLQQLVSADGMKSEIQVLPDSMPRTVHTICKTTLRANYSDLDAPNSTPTEARRYSYRKELPAIIYIYEEDK